MTTTDEATAKSLSAETVQTVPPGVNDVHLVGRVAAAALERTLPSGDVLVTVRVIVDREAAAVRRHATVDTVDCAVWLRRLQRSVVRWCPGDVVEIEGALRRRFYRAAGAVASRVEVEVSAGRVVKRAAARRPARRAVT